MSAITNKFNHLFFKNKACQNLFLLSKYELLETRNFGTEESPYNIPTNRIIITNTQEENQELIQTIKDRSALYDVELNSSIEEKIEDLKPIIENFFNAKFKKSIDALIEDFDKNKAKHIIVATSAIFSSNREKIIIDFLKEYKFIGDNINSFDDIDKMLEQVFIPSKRNVLINEKTLKSFFEGIKYIKELYVNYSYKNLYNTNQVLVNTLNSEDNYNSRIQLFGALFDSKIITASDEDAFIECTHCPPLTYRGVFQLNLNPKLLKNLKCPVCNNALIYFVPYELHPEIYQIINAHDGVLLHAIAETLKNKKVDFKLNEKFLNDIEIDCVYKLENKLYLIESKMYKLNTTKDKLSKKIKAHFDELISKLIRIQELNQKDKFELIPILITNINDLDLLSEIKIHFEKKTIHKEYYQNGLIINLDRFKNFSNN